MHEIANYGVVHAAFILILLISRKRKPTHEKVLIAWMISLALTLLSIIIEHGRLDISIPIFQLNLMYPLTFGPFLWLYIKSLIGDIIRFDSKSFWHFLPFILVTFYQIIFDKTITLPGKPEIEPITSYDEFIILFNFLSLTYYSLISIFRLKKHGHNVLNHFSELPSQVTLKWLYWIVAWFVITYLLPFIASLLSLSILFQTHSYYLTIFVFILSFFGLKQTNVFKEANFSPLPNVPVAECELAKNEVNENVEVTPDESLISKISAPSQHEKNAQDKIKYERSGLTQDRSSMYLSRLEDYMLSEKPYLDADLTIEKLSKQISIPRHYLTQIISEQLDKNFYLFVNEYRVNTVKKYINDSENHPLTMLDIAYMSGFNSKSTFNLVFKKLTKMTPSQYKKIEC